MEKPTKSHESRGRDLPITSVLGNAPKTELVGGARLNESEVVFFKTYLKKGFEPAKKLAVIGALYGCMGKHNVKSAIAIVENFGSIADGFDMGREHDARRIAIGFCNTVKKYGNSEAAAAASYWIKHALQRTDYKGLVEVVEYVLGSDEVVKAIKQLPEAEAGTATWRVGKAAVEAATRRRMQGNREILKDVMNILGARD